MESIPTLNTFQLALLPDCSAEAEQELVNVARVLLVSAIEDPGIPHPGRHTTLLGHAIRMGDITSANLSEILRIYLYANATGEIKALTGLTAERERERRVADHHQTEAEMQHTQANSKNAAYYEHLHNNATYKLSEALRDKPFLALSATTKASILAFLCSELLQNKSVLRQIDASLEHLNQLKKERYLADMKIRKVRVLHQRKLRAEQCEKQQALALERMQRLVEESTHTNTAPPHGHEQTPEKESSKQHEQEKSPPLSPAKEPSPLKELSNGVRGKDTLNNNTEDCSPPPPQPSHPAHPAHDAKTDKDSVMGDEVLSDLESEGTQPEEDEDKNLSSEELSRKLEKLLRQSEQQLQQLTAAAHALRPTCFGQDRYWRRYWHLGKCGGIFVEALESAQPELVRYHQLLEEKVDTGTGDAPRNACQQERDKKEPMEDSKQTEQNEALKKQEALKTELELKNIKSELNLSDHTQIIKYEPNVKQSKVEGQSSSIKMEEKYIQHLQSNETEMLDIEDSIPTAFLVQKPTHAALANSGNAPQETDTKENLVKTEEKEEPEDSKNQLVNNLEELRKMAEAVSSQLEKERQEEEQQKQEIKTEKEKIEADDTEAAHELLYTAMLEGKWFSILRRESSFLLSSNSPPTGNETVPPFTDNTQTCNEVIMCQGHRWDVSNNLHLLNEPSLFTLNSMVTSVQVPSNNIYLDSSLTMSGLEQDLLDSTLNPDSVAGDSPDDSKEQDNDLEKELQADSLKHDLATQRAKAHSLTSLGLLNFNALSTYVTCDSPPPVQMAPEELQQLEHAKVHGLPDALKGNYVEKTNRHGWWRVTDPEELRALMEALHPRGVRERELHAALQQHVPVINNKLYIDKGDVLSTELSVSHLDRVIAQNGGYPPPDSPGSYSVSAAYRLNIRALEMVEQLEQRVIAASLHVKGWRLTDADVRPGASGTEIVAAAREKLADIEAHIERRYMKPPFVHSTTEATIGAVLSGELNSSSEHNDNDSRPEKGIARGLATWREALSRCSTGAQLAMLLQALEAAVAWDKSIMKANCQFCLLGDNEEQLLLCDGCDKGYHTYCFKPVMDNIPDGDWYCWECVNKARGERVCIVCGGTEGGRTIPCALCVRAYHQQCHYPPLGKNPRGKWYCAHCIARAPPKKPRNSKKRDNKRGNESLDDPMVPSPAASHASTSTTAEDCPGTLPAGAAGDSLPAAGDSLPAAGDAHTPDKHDAEKDESMDAETHNHLEHTAPPDFSEDGPPPEKRRAVQYSGNGAVTDEQILDVVARDVRQTSPGAQEAGEAGAGGAGGEAPLLARTKKEKTSARKLHLKDMQFCKSLLCEMECHEHAWPFLIPVNTKQFPQYKKVIKSPMDLSTIRKKLQDSSYKSKEEFASDVRLIFSNCEVFNEDESPVGRAGHHMRQFFDQRWTQL